MVPYTSIDNQYSVTCPVCYSDTIAEITEEEKTEALALWDMYDFIGRVDIMTLQYRCTECGYQW